MIDPEDYNDPVAVAVAVLFLLFLLLLSERTSGSGVSPVIF